MQIGEREFIEIPGDPSRTFELPPLLITKEVEAVISNKKLLDVIENDGLIEAPDSVVIDDKILKMIDAARHSMAVNLSDKYVEIVTYWHLGNSILQWVNQCETTFRSVEVLKFLVRPDVWPRADQKNIAELLPDKSICQEEELKLAVGARLSYRKLPPAECFSDKFLFFLEPAAAMAAYDAWAIMSPQRASLPPERFHFEVIDI